MNYQDANKCLDALEQTNSENDLSARIEARSLTCKGIVTDWLEGIPDFWECIADHSQIVKMEKMIRRKWDAIKREWAEEDTGNIILTMKGSKLPYIIGLYENTFHINHT